MKKNIHTPGGAAALCLALCLTLCLALTGCGGGEEETEDASVQENAGTAVQISTVTRSDIATDNKVSGSLAAEDEATVMVAVSAKCTAVYADAGDVVRQGDALCTLDLDSALSSFAASQINYDNAVQSREDQAYLLDRQIAQTQESIGLMETQLADTREQIAIAEAQIPLQEAQIPLAEAQIPMAQDKVPEAERAIALLEEQIANMEARLEQAEKNASDTESLYNIGAASQMELTNARLTVNETQSQLTQMRNSLYTARAGLDLARLAADQARLAADQARLAVESANAQIEQLKTGLIQQENSLASVRLQLEQQRRTRATTLAQLDAGVESARAAVQQQESILRDVDGNGNVIAPMGGTLVTFNAIENSFISTAMPLAVIQREGNMKLTASVSEALVPKLHAGDQADVYISSLDRNLTAFIRSVERSASAQTRLYTVTLTLPEGTTGLLSGMSADVTFHTDRVEGAVVVPSEAILTNGPADYVFIVADGRAKYVEIAVGLTGTGVTEVLSGLQGGEKLVTVGQSYLTDGDPVRVVSEN